MGQLLKRAHSKNHADTMTRKIALSLIPAILAFCALLGQAHAAATLLPPGEQCFSATTPTSGGLYGPITTLGTITGGSGYVSATYTNVPFTGGNGFGAKATIIVSGGAVASISVSNPGSHFAVGDTLSATAASLGGSGSGFSVPVSAVSTTGTGMLGLLGNLVAGTGGASGTYAGVSLTGGSGMNATANITVSGGGVTQVTILNPGVQYQVGDTLSAASGSIGSTSGFSIQVESITINNALAGGNVYFYIPNTTTFKQTWQNSAQTILNTNPVTLDGNGCAIIYGTGTYRQVLQDSIGDTVWDQPTTDTSAQQNTFWAGLAGGTPNAITLVDPGFNGTDGSIINFTALSTNTGGVTINPSSFGNIAVLKDTSIGSISLTGGEIVSGNPISVLYRSVDSSFHILNSLPQSHIGTALYPNTNGFEYDTTSAFAANTLGAKNIVVGVPAATITCCTWLNTYLSGVDVFGQTSLYAISPPTSGPGGWTSVFAARSSDFTDATPQNIIPNNNIVVHDNTSIPHLTWSGYDALYITSTAITSNHIGREVSMFNSGAGCGAEDPFNVNPSGSCVGYRSDCAASGGFGGNDCSAGLDIVNNGARFISGINIANDSLDSVANVNPPAIQLPNTYALTWYSSAGTVGARVYNGSDGLMHVTSTGSVQLQGGANTVGSCTSLGTGSCTLTTGSNNNVGQIVLNAGSGATSAGSTTITFSASIGANSSQCFFTPENGTGGWTAPVGFIGTSLSPIAYAVSWSNGGSASLTSGQSYLIGYLCLGH